MPPVVDASRFIELVKKSKLVAEPVLKQAVKQLRAENDGQIPSDIEKLEAFFVQQDLLTTWHCEKLRNGKYKGFFLSKYRLLKHLGTGGMSSVYLGEHIVMNRKVAIKVLPRSRVNDPAYLARFHLEAQTAALLDHPNIVRAFDIDNEESTHYIVMEYVPGKDLRQIVREHGAVPFEAAADYIAQAADGLQHAHDTDIVHRDIKPANLLLDERGIIKILDMGLARLKSDLNSASSTAGKENILGTADYLAPEQADNHHHVDHRVDIYGLGCSLYFLLTGHPPFPEGSMAQRVAKHRSVMPEEIRKSRPNCPIELQRICEKMIAKNPNDRFAEAKEVAAELRSWLESRGKEPTVADEEPGSAILSAAAQKVSNRIRSSGQSHNRVRVPGAGSSISSYDLQVRERRESSSSKFDPAQEDTIANRANDTAQQLNASSHELRRGNSNNTSSSSLFDSQELDDTSFDVDEALPEMEPVPSDSAAVLLESEAVHLPTANAGKIPLLPAKPTSSRRLPAITKSFRNLPTLVWVVAAAIALLVVVLTVSNF